MNVKLLPLRLCHWLGHRLMQDPEMTGRGLAFVQMFTVLCKQPFLGMIYVAFLPWACEGPSQAGLSVWRLQ